MPRLVSIPAPPCGVLWACLDRLLSTSFGACPPAGLIGLVRDFAGLSLGAVLPSPSRCFKVFCRISKNKAPKNNPSFSYLFARQRVRVFCASSQRTNATNIISNMITCALDPLFIFSPNKNLLLKRIFLLRKAILDLPHIEKPTR